MEDPAAVVHALALASLARTIHERRFQGAVGREAPVACRLATNALAIVIAQVPAPSLPETETHVEGVLARGASAWELTDEAADATTADALAEIDRRLQPSRRAVARLERAPAVAVYRATAATSLVTLFIAAIAVTAFVVSRPRNLLEGKAFKTSSTMKEFDPVKHTWNGQAQAIFFMTTDQPQPWIEYDLGAPTTIRRVVADNRPDCCHARAVPLVLEASDDEHTWRELARTKEEFASWEAKISPQTVRYIRLRVDKSTIFHLEAVGAYSR